VTDKLKPCPFCGSNKKLIKTIHMTVSTQILTLRDVWIVAYSGLSTALVNGVWQTGNGTTAPAKMP